MGWRAIENALGDTDCNFVSGAGGGAPVPGRDDAGGCYLCDEAVAVYRAWLDEVIAACSRNGVVPDQRHAGDLWVGIRVVGLTTADQESLNASASRARVEIEKVYAAAWGRPPRREEWAALRVSSMDCAEYFHLLEPQEG